MNLGSKNEGFGLKELFMAQVIHSMHKNCPNPCYLLSSFIECYACHDFMIYKKDYSLFLVSLTYTDAKVSILLYTYLLFSLNAIHAITLKKRLYFVSSGVI